MNTLTVTVSGNTHTGKTGLIEALANYLHQAGFPHVVIDYSPDGNPYRDEELRDKITESLKEKTMIVFKEVNTMRHPVLDGIKLTNKS